MGAERWQGHSPGVSHSHKAELIQGATDQVQWVDGRSQPATEQFPLVSEEFAITTDKVPLTTE